MIIHGSRWLPTSIDKAAAAALGLVALLAGTFACAPVKSAGMEAARPLIHLDDTGKLVYVPDEKGNVIPDFSNAGYGGGGVPIPDVPVKVVVGPGAGDDGERIQAAIDRVSRMEPDANGHRGAVLLRRGEYQIAGTLRLSAGGVVLRGEGRDRDGTVLMATGTSRRTLIEVNPAFMRLQEHRSVRVGRGRAWREVPGTRRAITDAYVPVGARTFRVESTQGLAAGDRIIVHRPSTSAWISAIGMDRIPPRPGRVTRQWQAGQYDLRFDRVIANIRDTEVTIDAPLVNAIEQEFGGGWIYKYAFPERIAQVGIEHLRAESHFNGWPDDEDHAWNFILLDAVENAWVRNVTGVHFAYSCVYVERHGKWITVEDAACLDPVSRIASPRRYPFALRGQLTLVRGAVSNDGRHDFVMHSRVPGPNVFLDCRSRNAHNDSGPHHRWAVGTLYDNVHVQGDALNVRDRGNMGTGHGWAGAQMMFWNSSADSIICEKPPTAQNWAIGSSAYSYSGDCYWYSLGKPVEPRSLYLKQLEERVGRHPTGRLSE